MVRSEWFLKTFQGLVSLSFPENSNPGPLWSWCDLSQLISGILAAEDDHFFQAGGMAAIFPQIPNGESSGGHLPF